MSEKQFTEDIQKYRIFFKDLIVLARETMYCYDIDINIDLEYVIFEKNQITDFYRFKYDIKIKKWILTSYEFNEPIIFNPKVNSGIKEFLTKFDLSDLFLAHSEIEEIYSTYKN